MKIVNSHLLIIFILISFCCSSQEIKRIDIKYVDINIETPFRISNDNFINFFQNEIDSVSICDNKSITEFIIGLENLKKADNTIYSVPDARILINVVYNDKISTISADRFVVLKQDSIFILSESFKSQLERYINLK